MKKDSLYGPPTDIFAQESSKKQLYKRRKKKSEAESSSSSDDDQGIDVETAAAYDQARLRKYEIQKMKYYYAVVYCNTSCHH